VVAVVFAHLILQILTTETLPLLMDDLGQRHSAAVETTRPA
jgi:hypothetical protein